MVREGWDWEKEQLLQPGVSGKDVNFPGVAGSVEEEEVVESIDIFPSTYYLRPQVKWSFW